MNPVQLIVERERGCVTVYISNLPLARRLSVTFGELGWGYPSCEIAVDVNHHCGDITAAAAMVRLQPNPYLCPIVS